MDAFWSIVVWVASGLAGLGLAYFYGRAFGRGKMDAVRKAFKMKEKKC